MPKVAPNTESIELALAAFPNARGGSAKPFGGGLINDTFRVECDRRRFILQRLNPVFSPQVHRNINFVTEKLAAAGLTTPRLERTADNNLWTELDDGSVWRLMSYVDGRVWAVTSGPHQAWQAGHLVGRFHGALDGAQHHFVGLRRSVHDTPFHLDTLHRALRQHPRHRLLDQIAPLAAEIQQTAATLEPLGQLADRICHGDLKLDNLLFEADAAAEQAQAICLIDLDTVAPMHLAHELGDAWRSWCAGGPEDDPDPGFDLELFAASLDGYCQGLGRLLAAAERQALLLGPEWISLELASRFAADALAERYFGWNPGRYRSAGEHHLARARGQWTLHRAIAASRAERQQLLGL